MVIGSRSNLTLYINHLVFSVIISSITCTKRAVATTFTFKFLYVRYFRDIKTYFERKWKKKPITLYKLNQLSDLNASDRVKWTKKFCIVMVCRGRCIQ